MTKIRNPRQFIFILFIIAHYNPCLIRRRLSMSGPNGLDKPFVLIQSGLLGVSFRLFPRAMKGEQGGDQGVAPYRSRGRGRSTKGCSRGVKQKVSWQIKTIAVEPQATHWASDAESSNPHSVPVSDAETAGSNLNSIPGDSVVGSDTDMEERIERKRANAQPKLAFHGDGRSRGESSIYNAEPEVGNIGIFFGNWGQRAVVKAENKRKRTERSDRQISRCPAQIIILAEANASVEEVLKSPPLEAESPGASGLSGRPSFEHFVVRGNEKDAAVLIAARKDTCTHVDLLDYDLHFDSEYREKGRNCMAYTRMLSCTVGFKQNVGHIGKSVNCMGVHGNSRTMKMTWKGVYDAFWDRLAAKIKEFHIEIMAGDFNMALTRVIPELRSRGLKCDCLAWYPWIHRTQRCHEQPLGFDSCGIFYIGGSVQVQLHWNLNHLHILAAVADDFDDDYYVSSHGLHKYGGDEEDDAHIPGQPWQCYRSIRHVEHDHEKNLRARLTELLSPSTAQEDLDMIPRRPGKRCIPYLRFKQKPLNLMEWFVDGKMHNGSHFPLCTFTQNASHRSKESQEKRDARLFSNKNSGQDSQE